jgi:hypothetical protein
VEAAEVTSSIGESKPKSREYCTIFISHLFTDVCIGAEERPQYVICHKIPSVESVRRGKLKLRLETS